MAAGEETSKEKGIIMKQFVTFEGIDGSGKSTVSQHVFENIKSRGIDVLLTVEPTDTDIGRFVKKCIATDADPFVTTFAFLTDRIHHGIAIQDSLDKGTMVLCDRYMDSTIAYQAAQLEDQIENPLHWLKQLSRPRIPKPDCTFLFVLPPEIALDRIQHREHLIPFERQQFLEKVHKNYLQLAKQQRFRKLDATRPVEDLVQECLHDILG
jgi:dTMP kinase